MFFNFKPNPLTTFFNTTLGLKDVINIPEDSEKKSIGWNICENEEPCAMDAFFKHQQQLHPNIRSTTALLVCHCKRCNPCTL